MNALPQPNGTNETPIQAVRATVRIGTGDHGKSLAELRLLPPSRLVATVIPEPQGRDQQMTGTGVSGEVRSTRWAPRSAPTGSETRVPFGRSSTARTLSGAVS